MLTTQNMLSGRNLPVIWQKSHSHRSTWNRHSNVLLTASAEHLNECNSIDSATEETDVTMELTAFVMADILTELTKNITGLVDVVFQNITLDTDGSEKPRPGILLPPILLLKTISIIEIDSNDIPRNTKGATPGCWIEDSKKTPSTICKKSLYNYKLDGNISDGTLLG